jgi:hypothetical protein
MHMGAYKHKYTYSLLDFNFTRFGIYIIARDKMLFFSNSFKNKPSSSKPSHFNKNHIANFTYNHKLNKKKNIPET